MHTVIMASSIHEVWDDLLANLFLSKSEVDPRGHRTHEIIGVQLNITDMRNNILVNTGRDLNYRFMVAEWLWISLGRNDVGTLSRYNKVMENFSDNGETLNGAYGPPVVGQLPYVLWKLKNDDPHSRQAVINLWKNSPAPSKDIPCTLSMQFLVRKQKLHMIVNMRSSDVWLGIPYDVFNFTQIGIAIAGELGVEPGHLTLNLGSSHIYEKDIHAAQDSYYNWKSFTLRSQKLPGWPPQLLNDFFNGVDMVLNNFPPWDRYIQVLLQPSKEKALGVLKKWLNP